tara:strand:+ start:238 stop:474 length:237 start_codon:yes stop_codon:yes gene_type:complete
MTSTEQMAKALQEFEPRVYDSRKPSKSPWQVKLAKLALLAYFALTMFALGQFTTIYSDGILFEVSGFASYWVDFGGAE